MLDRTRRKPSNAAVLGPALPDSPQYNMEGNPPPSPPVNLRLGLSRAHYRRLTASDIAALRARSSNRRPSAIVAVPAAVRIRRRISRKSNYAPTVHALRRVCLSGGDSLHPLRPGSPPRAEILVKSPPAEEGMAI